MTKIQLINRVGSFAENKDTASDIRKNIIIPALEKGEVVVLDFSGVEVATQSFVHALISDLFRTRGSEVLDNLEFSHCNETVQKIIGIVVDYMQDS